MKFIHIADVHLGAEPEGIKQNRGKEIWETFADVVELCEREKIDLLLIAGDLFHRQPLLRELKEVNYLFSRLTKTRVVLMAGNHDYMKRDSYYHTFEWSENVYPLFGEYMECVEFQDLDTCVYGFSFYQREIKEGLYDYAEAPRRQKYEILLAHGGDENHIPMKKEILNRLGYDYIALGHIHKPQVLVDNRIAYAGALEPIDRNDVGKHGFIRGGIDKKGVKISFEAIAKREYVHLEIEVGCSMTNGALKERIRQMIAEYGKENIYKLILTGFRDVDICFEPDSLKDYGNIIEVVDETNPAYDFDRLLQKNQGNLIGRYIESLKDCRQGSVEYKALYEGVQALLETKRG